MPEARNKLRHKQYDSSALIQSFIRGDKDVQSRTTVMTTHHPHYQPVATNLHPAYRGQPILTGPCQQTYLPRPPPTYQEAASQFPTPYSQAPYDDGQIMYPLQPTNYTSPQSDHNPVYRNHQRPVN